MSRPTGPAAMESTTAESRPTVAEVLTAAPAEVSAVQAAAVHAAISRQRRAVSPGELLSNNEKAPDHVTVAEGRAPHLAPKRSPEASSRVAAAVPVTDDAAGAVMTP